MDSATGKKNLMNEGRDLLILYSTHCYACCKYVVCIFFITRNGKGSSQMDCELENVHFMFEKRAGRILFKGLALC